MSDDADFGKIEAWCASLIERLEPAQRRALARELAKRLRETQAKRIAAQKNPDGSDYAPRKPQLRRKVRRGRVAAMFAKMRTSRFLHLQATPDAAVVAFSDDVQRIAKVHQGGLRDRVNKRGLTVQYPARELLGFTPPEVDAIADVVLTHLAG